MALKTKPADFASVRNKGDLPVTSAPILAPSHWPAGSLWMHESDQGGMRSSMQAHAIQMRVVLQRQRQGLRRTSRATVGEHVAVCDLGQRLHGRHAHLSCRAMSTLTPATLTFVANAHMYSDRWLDTHTPAQMQLCPRHWAFGWRANAPSEPSHRPLAAAVTPTPQAARAGRLQPRPESLPWSAPSGSHRA